MTLEALAAEYVELLRIRHYSELSVSYRASQLADVVAFFAGLGVTQPGELTPDLIEAYRQDLARRFSFQPHAQRHRVTALRCFVRWLVKRGELAAASRFYRRFYERWKDGDLDRDWVAHARTRSGI